MDNYESKYKFSSNSEKFYNFNKIAKFCLYSTLVLFYVLILVLVIHNTSLHLGNQVGEASTLVVCSSHGVWGVLGSSRGPQQGLLLLQQPLKWGVSGGQLSTLRNSCLRLVLQKSSQWGYTAQDGIIKEGDIWLHHFPQLEDAPHQKAWLAQCRFVGFLCPILESIAHRSHGLLQLSLSDILAGELWI